MSDQAEFFDPGPRNAYFRMLRATLIARKHGCVTAWSGSLGAGSREISLIDTTRETPGAFGATVCHVSDAGIDLRQSGYDALLSELGAALELPVIKPPTPGRKAKSQSPRSVMYTQSVEPDAPVRRTAGSSVEVKELVYDPRHLCDFALGDDERLIYAIDDLVDVDLPAFVKVTCYTDSVFDADLLSDLDSLQFELSSRGTKIIEPLIEVPERVDALEPRAILFVLDPPDDLLDAEPNGDVLLVPAGPAGDIRCSQSVSFKSLAQVAFGRDVEGETAPDPDPEQWLNVKKLTSRMQSILSWSGLDTWPEISDDLDDYRVKLDRLDRDAGNDYGM